MSKEGRKELAATASSTSHSRLDIIKDWLNGNYEVKVNMLDRSRVYLSPTENCSVKYEFPVTEEDIILHAFADELPISAGLLRKLLTSPNQMKAFNPVREYLEGLRGKYKGPSQIDLLSTSLHLVDEKARKRSGEVLRKWLVATVACALGVRQNDVALGLVGERAGIGKTTFFEQIVPPCLSDYYQVAQKDDRTFQMQNAFAHRFLLNFDEFAAITTANEQPFKQMMSATTVTVRRTGSWYNETVQRVASCCFTSNRTQNLGGFIKAPDDGLLRRLAVIEVESIDDYRQKLDVDQLWAEAVMLLDGGFDPVWSQQEYQQFVRENRQYVIESKAVSLIRRYFRLPEKGEEPQFMTASEIVQLLKDRKIIKPSELAVFSETKVGMALSVLSFRRYGKWDKAKGIAKYGYDVISLFE